jgi:hypothetical protein
MDAIDKTLICLATKVKLFMLKKRML